MADVETPPRAWGRPDTQTALWSNAGNTPTGVGKTKNGAKDRTEAQKHPHGRGEDLWGQPLVQQLSGNTPTGVGKTIST